MTTTFETLKAQVPDYAKDVRMNVGSLSTINTLNPQQLWGAIMSCAMATRNASVLQAAVTEATPHLSVEAMNAAKTAGALMAMNNIYYRFTHLVGNADYQKLPARLRMNAIGNPGVDKLDFELWSLGVSAINGCGLCIESHESHVTSNGATKEMVQDTVRIAAILQSLAVTLEAEVALGVNSQGQSLAA